MNVRKFVAANARDALRKVKETLGSDAIILSNRSVPGGVEIMAVAARDMAMIVPSAAGEQGGVSAHRSSAAGADDDYRLNLSTLHSDSPSLRSSAAPMTKPPISSEATRRGVPPAVEMPKTVNAAIPKNSGLRSLELPRSSVSAHPRVSKEDISTATVRRSEAEVVPAAVMDEIRSLRKIVEQHLAGLAWGEAARTAPAKTEVLRLMLDSGFSPQFTRELLDDLPTDMTVTQSMVWVKNVAERSLFTVGAESDIVDRGGVYALVGPTGVGKTTTTAKLAARCVLKHGPNKVALITTDGYRIGAHEQLRIYGRILGVSVYLVKDANELHSTLGELRHKHLVLIDTMGMSQKDKLVPELTGMLAGCEVRRLLLLSSTSRGDTLDDVVRAYHGTDMAGCILTKVDEAASLATALDVIMRHRLRLHYVSNGQRVPEDLHLPNRAYLLHRAFKDLPESSPHKFAGMEPALMMANAGMVATGRPHRG